MDEYIIARIAGDLEDCGDLKHVLEVLEAFTQQYPEDWMNDLASDWVEYIWGDEATNALSVWKDLGEPVPPSNFPNPEHALIEAIIVGAKAVMPTVIKTWLRWEGVFPVGDTEMSPYCFVYYRGHDGSLWRLTTFEYPNALSETQVECYEWDSDRKIISTDVSGDHIAPSIVADASRTSDLPNEVGYYMEVLIKESPDKKWSQSNGYYKVGE